MNAIHTIQRALRAAKHQRRLSCELHGRHSASYRAQTAEIERLQADLQMLKAEVIARRGLQVIGSAA